MRYLMGIILTITIFASPSIVEARCHPVLSNVRSVVSKVEHRVVNVVKNAACHVRARVCK